MEYNHGREERKWRIWKEAEKKILRKCGVSESIIEEIRIDRLRKFLLPCFLFCGKTKLAL